MTNIEQSPVNRPEDRTAYFNRLNMLMLSRLRATAIEPCGESAILWALCGGIWPESTTNPNRPPDTRAVVYGITTQRRTAFRALVSKGNERIPLDIVHPPIDATAHGTNPVDTGLVESCLSALEHSTFIPDESVKALQAIRKYHSLFGAGAFAQVARPVLLG